MSEEKIEIDVLNTGRGHLTISFDPTNAIELEQARATITDMLRRGYMLFIEHPDKTVSRVTQFDDKAGYYIIGNTPDPLPDGAVPYPLESPGSQAPRQKRGRKVAVPMTKAKVTAIGPSAGG